MNLKGLVKKEYGLPLVFLTFGFLAALSAAFFITNQTFENLRSNNTTSTPVREKNKRTESPSSTSFKLEIPQAKTLANGFQVFQSYNNCGPASLSMALSYYGINKPQSELGQELRPYQIPGGDNDDKSVTLEELAEKSKEFGFTPYHRPVGNADVVKQFIALELPVITRTWTTPTEDIGHYRVIKGYDATGFIQDDSLQGKDLHYTFDEFDAIWKQFNYEYLILVPQEKVAMAEQILGENSDAQKAWENAVTNAERQLSQNPEDIHAKFNLSVALTNTGEHKRATEEFEKVESELSFRTLWYQIEPIESYYQLGNYNRVFEITDKILNNHNKSFSELYIIRGNIYKKQGNIEAARAEFEKAVQYNTNMKAAHAALDSLN